MSHRPLLMTPWFVALAAICAHAEDQVPFPNLAPTVGEYLEHDYYDHSRFHPHLMVERALRALETSEPSLDTTWTGNVIALTIGTVTQNITVEEPKTLAEAMVLVERVRLEIDKSSLPAKRKRDLVYNMVNGALTCLDPHTVIMPPEPAKEFREDIAGEFYGIGAFLHQEEGRVSIERVMPGLPADKAGVEDGDVILGIDGEKTAGLSLEQAVRRIKGPKGTSVTLTVERKAAAGAIDIPITRDLVQVITMRSHRSGDVGYVRMDEFNGFTARDLYRSIQELQKAGPMKAFVLDLRFNGGGLLDQARLVSDFFLPKGDEIVRTVTVDGQPQIYKSSSRQILDAPMVVITSGGSASAAEILSGCLQCNDRAVVIGSTSFGKGSVQTVKDLSDGSRLKLTIQEYQLPGGVSIQDVGVNPDVKLVQHTVRKDGSIDLRPFSGNREADDEFALKNRKAYDHPATYELGWLSKYLPPEELKKSGIASKEFVPDQEASLIIDLLVQTVVGQDFTTGAQQASKDHKARQFLLERLKPAIITRRDNESGILAEALAKRASPVTWGAAAPAPAGVISLTYTGPATIAAGDDKELTFAVKNTGTVPVGRLYGIVKADKFSPFWEDEVVFGEVAAGQSTSGVLRFKVPPRAYSGEERFELELFHDGQPELLASIPVRVAIQAQPRPHLGYSWRLEDQNGNGQLNADETAAIQLTLINDGDGPTSNLDLRVFKDNDPYVQLGENRTKLDPLPKGGTVTIKVPITVLKEVKRGDKMVPFSASSIKLQVRAEERFEEQDGRFRATLFHALAIPVNAPLNPHPIHQPLLVLTGVEALGSNQVKISIKVDDANLRFLTTFLDEDKVDLFPASKLAGDGMYTAKLTLKPGANSVRVMGFDEDEVDEILPIRLWGEGQVPAPANAVAKPAPAPAKSVDNPPPKKGIIIP